MAYKKPQITGYRAIELLPTVYRCNSQGEFQDNGTRLRISFSWTIDNSATLDYIQIAYKNLNSSGYYQELLRIDDYASTTKYGNVDRIISSVTFDANSNYSIRIRAKDNKDQTDFKTFLSSSFFTLDIGASGKSVALGMYAPNNVSDHPNGLLTVAMDVADLSTWQPLTLSSAFTAYNNSSPPAYRKRFGMIQVSAEVKPTAAIAGGTATHLIATLPVGFRPHRRITTLCQGSTDRVWECQIDTDGSISLSRYRSTGTSGWADLGTSTWLPFDFVFIAD